MHIYIYIHVCMCAKKNIQLYIYIPLHIFSYCVTFLVVQMKCGQNKRRLLHQGRVQLRRESAPRHVKRLAPPQKAITFKHMRVHYRSWCKPSKYSCVPSRLQNPFAYQHQHASAHIGSAPDPSEHSQVTAEPRLSKFGVRSVTRHSQFAH